MWKTLFYICAPALGGELGLAFFSLGAYTAYGYLISLFVILYKAQQYYWNHHTKEAFDDKLSTKRIEESTKWWINKCKGGDKKK